MPLSVAVHKDIGEYTEKIVGKLSLRTLLCVVGGLATSVAVAAAVSAVPGLEVADASMPIMAASTPFWLLGFWRPHGMRAERFAPLLAEHLLGGGVLLYRGPGEAGGERPRIAERTTRAHRKMARRRGSEQHGSTER